MRLSLNLGYLHPRSRPEQLPVLAREAEQLGFSAVWVAEATSSDAPSLLAWIAGRTTRIGLGAALMQIPARTAAATARAAATLDACSGGRFHLGLGVSGPQVSEGWHGVRFDRPLARTRAYVAAVRDWWTGQGQPQRRIHLGAIGPRSLELAGEIGDGWHGLFLDPDSPTKPVEHLRAGRQRAGLELAGFDVVATVPMVVGDDIEACARPVRPYAALYLGGMGSRTVNYYNQLARDMGFGEAADRVRSLYLDGDPRALAAVPLEFLDRTSLLGPVDRIAQRMRRLAEAGVTTLAVSTYGKGIDANVAILHAAADALRLSGCGEQA